jgi:acyl-CoA synthetase (AMP-forming)/AMP-acid ligase II
MVGCGILPFKEKGAEKRGAYARFDDGFSADRAGAAGTRGRNFRRGRNRFAPAGPALARSTWGDLYRRSRRLASALTGLGLRRGDRVATLLWNQSEHVEAYFGVPSPAACCTR